jgi:hypothetical protein
VSPAEDPPSAEGSDPGNELARLKARVAELEADAA